MSSLRIGGAKVPKEYPLWLVGADCASEKEEEFNEWYDKVHIPMVLKAPGMVSAKRYRVIEGGDEYPKFLAVYELESEAAIDLIDKSQELAAARQEMRERWGERGFTIRWRVRYRPIGP